MHFEDFELDLPRRELRLRGQAVPLGARAFDVLALLARHHERLVTKDELLDEVWAGVVVEENNLQVQISGLRRLLGPKAIATVPGRGYRLVARAQAQPPLAAEAAANAANVTAAVAGTPAAAGGAAEAGTPPSTGPGAASGGVAASGASAADNASPGGAPGSPAQTLPAPRASLLGREQDTQALLDALAQHRLVTVSGPGGIGKTSLALAVAYAWQRQQPAGQAGPWWAELATLPATTDVPALARSLGSALGLKLGMAADAATALAQALGGLQGLLVLDNAEHLAPACAALLAQLLVQVPGLRWLVTSQVRLQLPQEQVFPLEALPVPASDASPHQAWGCAALQLLLQRAQAGHPGLRISDAELPAAIQICRQLDGLPLAIELAAARVRWMGSAAVADRLIERLHLLARRSPEVAGSAAARQQTLRGTLAWSHALLAPDEQRLLHLLAVFSGGFALGLAERAATLALQWPAWEVLDVLGSLVDKSWVQVETAGTAAEPRYRLLESARLYALEQLQLSGGQSEAEAAHAQAIGELAERHLPHWLHGRHDTWYAVYLPEADNLRAAYDHALSKDEPALAARLFMALSWVLNNLDQVAEAALRADVLERRFGPQLQQLPAAQAVPLWMGLALARSTMGHDRSRAAAAQALQRSREPGIDTGTRAYALIQAAQGVLLAGDTAGAQSCLDEAAVLLQGQPLSMLRTTWYAVRMLSAICSGQSEAALAAAESALQGALHFGNRRLPAIIRANLCSLALDLGQHERAAEQAQALLQSLPVLGAAVPRAMAGSNLLVALTELGRLEEARSHLLATMAAANPVGYLSAFLETARRLAQRCGAFEIAARLAGHAAQLHARGEVSSVYEPDQQAHDQAARRQAELAAALGPRLDALLAEGAAMDELALRAQIAALADGRHAP